MSRWRRLFHDSGASLLLVEGDCGASLPLSTPDPTEDSFCTNTSIRRLANFPSAVTLSEIGCISPNPWDDMRSGIYALLDQVGGDGIGAGLTQDEVGLVFAVRVGVTGNQDRDRRAGKFGSQEVESDERLFSDIRTGAFENDRIASQKRAEGVLQRQVGVGDIAQRHGLLFGEADLSIELIHDW